MTLVDDKAADAIEAAILPDLSEADLAALRRAVSVLENPGLAARLSAAAGAPLDMIGRALPAPITEAVSRATESAMRTSLRVALATLPDAGKSALDQATLDKVLGDGAADSLVPTSVGSKAANRFARYFPSSEFGHKALAALSGAVGGAFGLATLAVELPVSTTLMLRSIAQIAREEGEDLSDPANALACVQVFALGGRSESPLTENGYFAVRAALAKTMAEAARYAGNRALLDEAAPALIRFSAQIASRFGIVVSQKLAAQAVPILGAVGGAAVNAAFMDHFQATARAHFTVRRLERAYGPAAVRAAYEVQKATLAA